MGGEQRRELVDLVRALAFFQEKHHSPTNTSDAWGREKVVSADADVVVAVLVERERAAGGDDDDRERLLDEGRARDAGAGAETRPVVHGRVDELMAEVHGPVALAGLFRVADVARFGQAARLGR